MIQFQFDKYKIAVEIGKEPIDYNYWIKYASFIDIEEQTKDKTPIYIGIGEHQDWYKTIVSFSSDPIDYGGFNPGLILVPETDILFIGAGTNVRIYDLKHQLKLFVKELHCGFLGWKRYDDFIIMQEELEFGIYSLTGQEIWSTEVEPPWTFSIEIDTVKLNVMNEISFRDLKTGELLK